MIYFSVGNVLQFSISIIKITLRWRWLELWFTFIEFLCDCQCVITEWNNSNIFMGSVMTLFGEDELPDEVATSLKAHRTLITSAWTKLSAGPLTGRSQALHIHCGDAYWGATAILYVTVFRDVFPKQIDKTYSLGWSQILRPTLSPRLIV